jgi:hypothetical protein
MRGRFVFAALALAILGSSCTFSNLSFRIDHRIKIVEPRDRTEVRPPLTLRWTARDFDAGPGALGSGDDYYMVFVDRQPMRPGGTVRSLGDDICRREPDCPNEQWLNDHWIFVTTSTSLDLPALPNLLPTTTRSGTKEDHSITIILMRGDRRIGEASFSVDFFRTIRQ